MGQHLTSEPQPKGTIPAVHALHLVDLLAGFDVNENALFEGTGLSRELLAAPGARLGMEAVAKLFERGEALSGRPDLGLQLGLHMRASSHGFLGFAVMTAENLGEALELASRYAVTRTDALGLRLERQGDSVVLCIDELVDLGGAREHLLAALLVGIAQIGSALTGRELRADVELAIPRPSFAREVMHSAQGQVTFDAPANRVHIARDVLSLPLVMADAASQRLAREQCERELSSVGEGTLLEARVRALIPDSRGGYRTVDQVARMLGMSTRTLKRRLSGHGLRFSELTDTMRRDRAVSLLAKPELSVDQVAERLGYSDTANFVRAFKRWTGQTPAVYRRAQG